MSPKTKYISWELPVHGGRRVLGFDFDDNARWTHVLRKIAEDYNIGKPPHEAINMANIRVRRIFP